MPCIEYVSKRFSSERLELIETANSIIAVYAESGYDLTLRQLYYQFVARGFIENSDREYKKLGGAIGDARMAGLIDWDLIVDRTRNVRQNSHWNNPQDIIEACADQFQHDKWEDQDFRIECWIEKDALIGVITKVCERLDIPFFSCRGYTSLSEMWAAGQRLLEFKDAGQTPCILHLGDHDPSGIDMTRDIFDRLNVFMGGTEVKRLALNFDQVEKYNPPPNPAKVTDSRAKNYMREHGDESWELDALEPQVIEQLIQDAVEAVRDENKWESALERERQARRRIQAVSQRWDELQSDLDEENK